LSTPHWWDSVSVRRFIEQPPISAGGCSRAPESAVQVEIFPDGQARFGLVQRVEMQARRAAGEQFLAHLADDLSAEGLDAVHVVTVSFQLLAHPAWDLCAADV